MSSQNTLVGLATMKGSIIMVSFKAICGVVDWLDELWNGWSVQLVL